MSKYEVPPVSPDAAAHLNNILLRADREFKRQLTEWAKQLDVCWCAPVTHGENARSKEEMQAIIDAEAARAGPQAFSAFGGGAQAGAEFRHRRAQEPFQ